MQYTRENIVDGINAKIESIFPDEIDRHMWKKKLSRYPKEIEQNVLEWVNNETITNIDCHGQSMRKIIDAMGLHDGEVLFLIYGFIRFKECNFRSSSVIGQYIRPSRDII